MANINIKTQFDLVSAILETDYVGVNEAFIDTNHNFFYQLQKIENRNVVEDLPVMDTICGYNFSNLKFNNLYKNNCIDVPKIEYTYTNGHVVATPVTVSTITGNGWVSIITDFLKFSDIRLKMDELYSVTDIFYGKVQKNGIDYITRADMAKHYVCNSLTLMRSVGNLFLHIIKEQFMFPTITPSYVARNDLGVDTFIPEEIIFKGIIKNANGSLIEHDGTLTDYINFLNNFIIQLNNFNIENETLDAGDINSQNQAISNRTAFLLSPAYAFDNTPNFCLNYLTSKSTDYVTEVISIIQAKIDLIKECTQALDYFDKILKIISAVAIVYNTSTEANQLQMALLQGSDDSSIETRIATQFAMESKWSYSQAEISKGIMIATKKTINYFNYNNIFEDIIDKVFEQGIPQYDQITT